MKGLIYKEWCLGKKKILPFIILTVMFSILGVLVFLSMKYGNLKDMMADSNPSFYVKIFSYVPFVILILGAEAFISLIYGDYETGWMNFSYTFPLSPKSVIISKYIVITAWSFISLIFGVLNALIVSAVSGYKFTVNVFNNMLIILVVINIYYAFCSVLAYAFRTKKAVNVFNATVISLVYFGFMGMFVYLDKKYGMDEEGNMLFVPVVKSKFEEFREVIIPLLPFILILFLLIGYFGSVKMYQRREKA